MQSELSKAESGQEVESDVLIAAEVFTGVSAEDSPRGCPGLHPALHRRLKPRPAVIASLSKFKVRVVDGMGIGSDRVELFR